MNNILVMKHVERNIIRNGIPVQHDVIDRIGNNNIAFVKEKHNNLPTLRYIVKHRNPQSRLSKNVRFESPFVELSNKIDRMPTPYVKSKKTKQSKKMTKGKKSKTKTKTKKARKTSKNNKSINK